MTKLCPNCIEPNAEFYKDKSQKDGLTRLCKDCYPKKVFKRDWKQFYPNFARKREKFKRELNFPDEV